MSGSKSEAASVTSCRDCDDLGYVQPHGPLCPNRADGEAPHTATLIAWVVVCADGSDHRDYGVGEVLTTRISKAATEQSAKDAAEFMDAERENSPWTCGPHTVRPEAG